MSLRIMKITKILEFHIILIKDKDNNIIPFDNIEKQKQKTHLRIQCKKNENHENHYANYENHRIPIEKHENNENQ